MSSEEKELSMVLIEDSTENSPESGPRSISRLPDRIRVYYSVRKQGANAGSIDWFYVDEETGKRYRSRKEVFRAFDTEEHNSTEHVSDTPQSSEAIKAEAREWKPKSVTWVITEPDSDEGAIPFVDGVEVAEEIRRVWAENFEKELNSNKMRRCMSESEVTPRDGSMDF